MDDFDITEFAKMFDAALASDNPAVKKALRNFMMVSAIVHAENGDQQIAGPLETLITKVNHLEIMIRELQRNQAYKDNYYKDYYNSNPTWVYQQPTTSVSTTGGTPYISGTSVDKFWVDEYDTIKDLLKDIKIK